LVIILGIVANCQDFRFRTYSFNNGLSSYNASKIVQDKFGFIWIATQEGVNRFDGQSFLTLKKDPINHSGLSENFITDIITDSEGKLWITSALGGVDLLNPGNLTIERRLKSEKENKSSLISNWTKCLAWSNTCELWIGTYFGLSVYNPKSNAYENISTNPFKNEENFDISFLGKDSSGNIIVGVEKNGIIIYNPDTKKIVTAISQKMLGIDEESYFKLNNIYIENNRYILLCTSQGIKQIRQNAFGQYEVFESSINTFKSIPSIDIRSIIKDKLQRFWIATNKGIFVTKNDGKFTQLEHSNFFNNTILDNDVKCLFKDKFENIWATSVKGLNHVLTNNYNFIAYRSKAGELSQIKQANVLFPENDSTIFACTSLGLYTIDVEHYSSKRIEVSENYGEFESMVRLQNHQYLVSTRSKLLILNKHKNRYQWFDAHLEFKELKPYRLNFFSSMLQINDSIILMASMEEEGLLKWDTKNHKIKNFKSTVTHSGELQENNFHNIKLDKKGNIWLLGNEYITMFDNEKEIFTNLTPIIDSGQNQPHFFFDMYDDGKFQWVTSYGGGLLKIDLKNNKFKLYTEEDGLSSNTAYSIENENDSIIWISSNNGLTRFNIKNETASIYDESDGLQSNAFDERSSCKLNQKIFFGGIDGFTSISPNIHYLQNPDVPVFVDKISYTNENGQIIELKTLENNGTIDISVNVLTFHIASPDYTNTSRQIFSYNIKELNNEWTKFNKNQEITIAALPPGEYTFIGRISKRNQYVYSKEIKFNVASKWYQTLHFKFLLFALILIVIYGVYKYRILQIKKQQEIRKAIANDLHDDFGGTLNSIKIFTHLAEVTGSSNKHLDNIKEALKLATDGLRDMIWVLDDKNDTAIELLERLQNFAYPLAEVHNIKIDLQMEGLTAVKLTKTEKRNLLMIAKEAINNSIKYSKCTEIRVYFSVENGRKKLVVKDNGHGFNPGQAIKGNGLNNIQVRAKQIKYEVNINSERAIGTSINIFSTL
jgi:ligand-binding sensor domain-containing protein